MNNQYSALITNNRRLPVAKFYYQGSHSHPVRRTIIVCEETPHWICGYEIREGKTVRSLEEAKHTVRTYRKDRIACWGDYCRLTRSQANYRKMHSKSTLERFSKIELTKSV